MHRERLILASQSPRRAALLRQVGQPFEVQAPRSQAEPHPTPNEPPLEYAVRMALLKAAQVRHDLDETDRSAWVLAADTIVLLDDEILGKPETEAEAKYMLTRLAGHAHSVITGFVLLKAAIEHKEAVETRVWFRPLSPHQIQRYIDTGEPMDKAGSYGIQGHAAVFIECIQGCYFNVVGLPIGHVIAALESYPLLRS